MLSAYSSRIFPKTLHKNPISPSIAFSLLKKFSPSTPLFQVRAMADSSAASSPFKKIQIQRGDSVSICCRVFLIYSSFIVLISGLRWMNKRKWMMGFQFFRVFIWSEIVLNEWSFLCKESFFELLHGLSWGEVVEWLKIAAFSFSNRGLEENRFCCRCLWYF